MSIRQLKMGVLQHTDVSLGPLLSGPASSAPKTLLYDRKKPSTKMHETGCDILHEHECGLGVTAERPRQQHHHVSAIPHDKAFPSSSSSNDILTRCLLP